MNNLSEYISEKLHLKSADNNKHNQLSYNTWTKYLEEIGLNYKLKINGVDSKVYKITLHDNEDTGIVIAVDSSDKLRNCFIIKWLELGDNTKGSGKFKDEWFTDKFDIKENTKNSQHPNILFTPHNGDVLKLKIQELVDYIK